MVDDVERWRTALQECPVGHSLRCSTLHNLANSLEDRFAHQGVLSDLNEAIELHRAALLLLPLGHHDRPTSLNNLAVSLHDRFEQQGILFDLDEAIELQRASLELCPPSHPHHFVSLNNLANSLQTKFEQWSIPSDLDEAIELHRAALELCPPDHSDRSTSLNNLASSLRTRFEQQSILSDLDEAIGLHRAALALCPLNHFDRSAALNNLANSLQAKFEQGSIVSDLDEAIELHRAALELRPPGHSDRSASLNNLANSLGDRFNQRGVQADLDEAVELHRAALVLRPLGHHDRSASLSNLAVTLHDRFIQWSVLSDLNEAIELHRAALELRPPGHSGHFMSLNNLACSLHERFGQQGVLSDLDEAIELDRVALELCPFGHSHHSASLSSLASSLRERFEQRGVLSDLDEAIELCRAALELRPPGHSHHFISLNELARSLHERFKERGVLSDLSEAIGLHQAALELCPLGHSHRSTSLSNLAAGLRARFKQRGVPSDLDEAIELHRAALVLRPPDHSHHSTSLHNLAITLHDRFKQQGFLSDLDEVIELHRAALVLRHPGRSERSTSLNKLAFALHDRFEQRGLLPDLNEMFGLHLQLSHLPHAASRNDLSAAKSWVASTEKMKHSSALLAYQTTLKFLDQHVAHLSSSSRDFDIVRKATSSLAMDAFSCSVRHGALVTAVELVEQGRAVFWTHLARFRTPLDELAVSGSTGAALAAEFRQLNFRLRTALDVSTADQSPLIRKLTTQRDDVIARIRSLPFFSRFLLPPLFSDLRKTAEDGPVILVNASQYSCDALIILSAQDPVHVPLHITQAEVSQLSSEFQSLIEGVGSSDHRLESHKIVGILRKIWDRIVGPVVEALRTFIKPGSRIWWCPTAEFTLLPLHAAGPYKKKSHNLSHFYISSYTPTLAALIRARQQVSSDASVQHFVAIGQAKPDRGRELLYVAPELDIVAQCLAPVACVTSLADSDATVQGALDALNDNQWLHLACHGMPNREEPFESSFAMRDGPLTIRDIIRSNWQNPEFAFLSACHTTVGDEMSPDESIHLAAAMQFSGFRSVIGSMWSVDDEVARQIVSTFYDHLVDGSGRLDCTRAAVALYKAVKSLRKIIPLEQQIVFVHIGI
ncbi:TPR-like protein [Suillus clintonianus]|uniref:TPR-like protein n=1 Tax=Suillus clintonianus TaxID=1904413 RepID=UPI001B879E3A|nr:TPR-like protein [Suillus clintonianus]KAG2153316.1 TPR-like protein [Suillus clintonianus]